MIILPSSLLLPPLMDPKLLPCLTPCCSLQAPVSTGGDGQDQDHVHQQLPKGSVQSAWVRQMFTLSCKSTFIPNHKHNQRPGELGCPRVLDSRHVSITGNWTSSFCFLSPNPVCLLGDPEDAVCPRQRISPGLSPHQPYGALRDAGSLQ